MKPARYVGHIDLLQKLQVRQPRRCLEGIFGRDVGGCPHAVNLESLQRADQANILLEPCTRQKNRGGTGRGPLEVQPASQRRATG